MQSQFSLEICTDHQVAHVQGAAPWARPLPTWRVLGGGPAQIQSPTNKPDNLPVLCLCRSMGPTEGAHMWRCLWRRRH